MEILKDFINSYGSTIIWAVVTALAGYIGIAIKNIFNKYVNDKTKKSVAKTCVQAVEQIYKDLHGEEKLDKCIESVSDMLSEKGITITELEIKMLIESAVKEMNEQMGDIFKTDDTNSNSEPEEMAEQIFEDQNIEESTEVD